MTLTPEERTKIYEEERARVEVREAATEIADRLRRRRRNLWFLWLIGAPLTAYAIWVGVTAFRSALDFSAADSSATISPAKP